MIANPESQKNQRELVVSTCAFLVFGSVLFLLERLGAPAIALIWSLVTALIAIALLFGFSGRTTSPSAFFCANRSHDLVNMVTGNLAAILSTPLFLLIVFLQSGNSVAVMVLVASVLAGLLLNGLLFAGLLRKSGAYSIPDYLGYRYNSKPVRLLALILVMGICAVFLYAELRFSALYLAPVLNFSFEQVTAAIIVIAATGGLMGGLLSVSKLQSALVLLILLAVIITATWLAYTFTGVPLPQNLWNYSGSIAQITLQAQPLIDARLAAELVFAFEQVDKVDILLVPALVLGFMALPVLSSHSFAAYSLKEIRLASPRSFIIGGILLTSIPALYYVIAANAELVSIMPVVLQILVPATVVMISISTTSLLLTIIATTLSHDGYQLLRPGKVPPNRQIFVARIAIILIAYGAWNYTIDPDFNALPLIIWALSFGFSCLLPVMLVSVFWSGASRSAALLAMIAGLTTSLTGFFVMETGIGQALLKAWFSAEINSGHYSAILTGLISMTISMVIIYLASIIRPPDEAVRSKLNNLRDTGKDILISANL